jgi:microcystin-dependent protein
MMLWANTTYPTGWLLADGSAISRVTYADLFAAIGTTYGVGDGSTTFNLPNMVSAGADSPNTIIKVTNSGALEPSAISHAANHTEGGSDVVTVTGNQIANYQSYRNLIINGAMQIAQRGTSTASITTSGYYTADRWSFSSIATMIGTWTNSVENDAPTGSGFQKSLKALCTTANASPSASATTRITMRLEGQDVQRIAKGTSNAQKLALSFWVKANVTGTYIAELFDSDNSRQVSAAYTIDSSGTWEKKTIVFPEDITGVFDNDNNGSLGVFFWLAVGSNYSSGTLNTSWAASVDTNRVVGQTNLAAATSNYWQVTGVQLEAGPVATPFEFEPFETTLRKCQRYLRTRHKPNSPTKQRYAKVKFRSNRI